MINQDLFNRKQKAILITMIVGFMIIGSCYDYSISVKLMNQDNIIGQLGAVYGHLPLLWALSVSGSLLLMLAHRNQKGILKIILGMILHAIAIGKIHYDQLEMFHLSYLFSFILALSLVFIVNVFFIRLFKDENGETIQHIVIFILIVTLGQLFLVNILKLIWSRPRMRMIVVQPEASFQPWWIIGCDFKETILQLGVRLEEFKSFPSGHTSAATCCFILCALPFMKEKWYQYRMFLFVGCLAFTFFVAISRIIMGAHFVSDVTMGFACTLFVIQLTYQYRKKFED